jgi:hypothetical protein
VDWETRKQLEETIVAGFTDAARRKDAGLQAQLLLAKILLELEGTLNEMLMIQQRLDEIRRNT